MKTAAWRRPAVFDVMMSMGPVEEEEMYRVFNMGLGMILVVPAGAEQDTCSRLRECGETAVPVGAVEKGKGEVILV